MKSPIVRQRLELMRVMASLNVPGRCLAVSFPVLAKMPDALAPWKRQVKGWGNESQQANAQLLNYVREDMENAKKPGAPPLPNSLAKQPLEQRAADPAAFALIGERDFHGLSSSIFGAGADTTASTLCSFILAIVTHQKLPHAAHAELDAVVGSAEIQRRRFPPIHPRNLQRSAPLAPRRRPGRHTPLEHRSRHIQRLLHPQKHQRSGKQLYHQLQRGVLSKPRPLQPAALLEHRSSFAGLPAEGQPRFCTVREEQSPASLNDGAQLLRLGSAHLPWGGPRDE